MSFKICGLRSSSRGCATLVGTSVARVLLDAGVSWSIFQQECESRQIHPHCDVIFVSHSHSDHIHGAATIARRCNARVLLSEDTLRVKAGRDVGALLLSDKERDALSAKAKELSKDDARREWERAVDSAVRSAVQASKALHREQGGQDVIALPSDQVSIVRSGYSYKLKSLEGLSFDVFSLPHDVPCLGMIMHCDGMSLGYLTDLGEVTIDLPNRLANLDVLMIEANYSLARLLRADYPPHVKTRIKSPVGHLSNQEVAALMECLNSDGRGKNLKLVLAVHLSGQGNSPDRVRSMLTSHWEYGEDDHELPRIECLVRKSSSPIYIVNPNSRKIVVKETGNGHTSKPVFAPLESDN